MCIHATGKTKKVRQSAETQTSVMRETPSALILVTQEKKNSVLLSVLATGT